MKIWYWCNVIGGIIAITIAAIVLTGCSPISSGVIVDKVVEPATWTSTPVCAGSKPMICTPNTVYDDRDWRLDIKDGDQTGWVYVDQLEFDRWRVGDWYTVPRS